MLDLFSGVGGFSYALKTVFKTVAYCEINDTCRQVLRARMRSGDICNAPIYEDVRTIIPNLHSNRATPHIITAGFPCQDISVANPNGKGLDGIKSGLFYEILNIIDNFPSISIVFMENSSHIVNNGFAKIKAEFTIRGFNVIYLLIRASDVGALHKRLRWYCLAYKPESTRILHMVSPSLIKFKWTKAMTLPKVIKIKSITHKKRLVERCRMLGNSIVPQCAIYAWNLLLSRVFDPSLTAEFEPFARQKSMKLVFTDGNTTIIKTQWATPVHSIWHNYTSLTDRGSRLLSNQTFYMQGISRENYNKYIANPEFVECLMGYPKNWSEY